MKKYIALIAHRNIGRPLAASDAQRATVLKLHKAQHSLRSIAEDVNLSLRTVRTIIDKRDGRGPLKDRAHQAR
jgi:Homeodomain-like domain